MNRKAVVTRAVLGLALVGGVVTALGANATPSASYGVKGIDISKYQHANGASINWGQVKASGVKFVIVGATQGTNANPANPYFKQDYQAAKDNGFVRGAYHFATPSAAGGLQNEAVKEAQAFMTALGGLKTHEAMTMAPVLDLETRNGLSDADLTTWTRAFANEVYAQTGRQPIVYVSACFFATGCTGLPAALKDLPSWIAAYTTAANPKPAGWSMWQWSSSVGTPGIVGNVDQNVFSGSLDQLVNNLGEGRTRDILALWRSVGGAASSLGDVAGDEKKLPNNAWEQDYRSGDAIVWGPSTGVHPLYGTTLADWRKHPEIGMPTTHPYNVPGGVVQEFQNADSFYNGSATNIDVSGDVRAAWHQAQSVGQGLGAPSTDMVAMNSVLSMQTFKNGYIVSTVAGKQVVWKSDPLGLAHALGADNAADSSPAKAVVDGVTGIVTGRSRGTANR